MADTRPADGGSCGVETRRLGMALHDLCQPLTTLQCCMEIAEMEGTDEAYRGAVRLGLAECERMVEVLGRMREILRAATREAELEEQRGTQA